MKIQSCVIVGHKATRFKFGYKENYAGCKRLKKRLQEQFALIYEKGVRHFWVGAAPGVDMWAGEILLRMKERPAYEGIELYIVLPFEGHDVGWDERSRVRMDFLRKHCREVMVVGTKKQSPVECYQKKNEYLLEQADCMVAVYDNERSNCSDVGNMVHFAEKQGMTVILIHPDTGVVSG